MKVIKEPENKRHAQLRVTLVFGLLFQGQCLINQQERALISVEALLTGA